ncbi:uncharacterized protein LOC135219976 [Macrobrachium nipponense]|uniref:uncharacterized protein LOC135219976 n=1 Tax=Macrobrachium nipponense TaxID=159736 RepID=UPI0030C89A04
MEKLKRTRMTCRGWVTRASKVLSDLLESSTTTISQFEYAIKEYDQRLAKLDEVQEAIEIDVAEEELEQLLDEAHEFRTKSVQPRIQAEDQIRKLAAAAAAAGPGSVSGQSSSQESDVTNVKLPKLELPKFSGEVTQWQSFWDQYTSHIDAQTFQNATTSQKDYFCSCQALLTGQVNINVSGPKGVAQLWKLRDDILIHIRSLEALGVTGKQCEVFLTPIILSRLPSELRLEWARDGDGHESDLDWLLTFLDKEISRLERSEAFKGKSSSEEKKIESKSSKDKVYSAAALLMLRPSKKTLCAVSVARNTKSENCFGVLELSGKERGEKIRSLGLCFKLEINLKKEESEAKVGAVGSDKPGDVALLTGQGGNCTILQTAKVQVSGSDGTVVTAQVMFDNGADRSYVSSKFVKKCKPQWITSAPMPYSSFGGHSSGKNEHRNVYELKLWDSDKKLIQICVSFGIWKTVGVKPRELVESYSETKVFKEFESTVKFVNGRYEVALPWKDDSAKEKLLNNEVIAIKG